MGLGVGKFGWDKSITYYTATGIIGSVGIGIAFENLLNLGFWTGVGILN